MSGKATSKDRLGSTPDLAMSMYRENVRVMVVNADEISRDTPDEKLHLAVSSAIAPGEFDKSRVVCAVLHKCHFDLAVLHTTEGVRAVFSAGQDWDSACRFILGFVKSRSAPKGKQGVSLCSRWEPRPAPSSSQKNARGVRMNKEPAIEKVRVIVSEVKEKEIVSVSEVRVSARKREIQKRETRVSEFEKVITREGGGSNVHAYTPPLSSVSVSLGAVVGGGVGVAVGGGGGGLGRNSKYPTQPNKKQPSTPQSNTRRGSRSGKQGNTHTRTSPQSAHTPDTTRACVRGVAHGTASGSKNNESGVRVCSDNVWVCDSLLLSTPVR